MHGKGERMTEEGMLSIVRRGTTYQVRYAPSNPYGGDRLPYLCPDEDTLLTLFHHCGMDTWSIHHTSAELRKGRLAVLPLVGSPIHMHVYFPPTPAVAQTQAPAAAA
jgi:hypothetical protein